MKREKGIISIVWGNVEKLQRCDLSIGSSKMRRGRRSRGNRAQWFKKSTGFHGTSKESIVLEPIALFWERDEIRSLILGASLRQFGLSCKQYGGTGVFEASK